MEKQNPKSIEKKSKRADFKQKAYQWIDGSGDGSGRKLGK